MPSARPSSFIDDVDYAADDASYVVSLGARVLRLSQVRWLGTQLRAQCLLHEGRELLFQSDLDIVGLGDRERLLRVLDVFAEDGVSHAATIHAFFARTLQHEAQIEQPIIITDAPPRTEARFIVVNDMPLLSTDLTMVFGDGGSRKSLISLWWAALLSLQGIRVLWLDWEMRVEDHQDRLRTLMGDEPLPNLYHMAGQAPLAQMEDALREHIKELQISYVVIDSALAASPGKNGSPADLPTEFFCALRRLKVGALIIGHTTKSGEDTRPFGSIYWHNAVRSSWHVASSGEYLVLTNRKDSHGGQVEEGATLMYHIVRASPEQTIITVERQ